jgi:hypothetical protein
LIKHTDQVPFTSQLPHNRKRKYFYFVSPGKFRISSDQLISAAPAAIAIATNDIFVPASMYVHVFKQSNELAQQVLKNVPTVSSLRRATNVVVPTAHPSSMYQKHQSSPSLKRVTFSPYPIASMTGTMDGYTYNWP